MYVHLKSSIKARYSGEISHRLDILHHEGKTAYHFSLTLFCFLCIIIYLSFHLHKVYILHIHKYTNITMYLIEAESRL